uniref:Uncharacterized protein n=1 Tax=Ciona intestinalis TaxID=7719 RepID=H2XYI7_CIOIN
MQEEALHTRRTLCSKAKFLCIVTGKSLSIIDKCKHCYTGVTGNSQGAYCIHITPAGQITFVCIFHLRMSSHQCCLVNLRSHSGQCFCTGELSHDALGDEK